MKIVITLGYALGEVSNTIFLSTLISTFPSSVLVMLLKHIGEESNIILLATLISTFSWSVPNWVVGGVHFPSARATHHHVWILPHQWHR